jgi:large subunit ribosomal protein L18
MIKHKLGKERRQKRIRLKIKDNPNRPRLMVVRSSQHIYTQIIHNESGKTLVSVSEKELPKSETKLTKSQKAELVGKITAEKAKKIKITKVVFDRNGYQYHGRVKAAAKGARDGGLIF